MTGAIGTSPGPIGRPRRFLKLLATSEDLMRRAFVPVLALAVGIVVARARAADPIDWEQEESSALELLRDMVRMDTRSRDETKLLEKLKARLEKIGLEPRIYEKEPGRGNLVVRMKGAAKGAPLLLMAHVDTVNFDKAEGWSADPLGAEIKNGELVGRGVLDDKGQACLAVTALELLRKERVELARDVVVMLNADEESSGTLGAKFMAKDHWEDIGPVGAALNEGGRCTMDREGKVYLVGIQTAEKIYNDVVISVKGKSGHSSVPMPGNAIAKLANVLAKLDAWKPTLRVIPAAQGTFKGFAATEKNEKVKTAMGELESTDEGTKSKAAAFLADADPRFSALLRSTFVFTMLRGGVKENQLPPSAEVNLNIRLLPDESIDDFLAQIRKVLGGEPVEIEVALRGEPSPPSPADHGLYKVIESAAKKHFAGATVVPSMSTGATDSRFFRVKGVSCYGLGPFPLAESHENSVHANDERLPVASFKKGLRYYYDLVRTYASTPD
jgi:acetylornithine deacetylase/succinyl-diaminopimelate desuccinylase-like protein